MQHSPQSVLDFWFEEIEPKQHWQKDTEFDQLITRRFADTHAAAIACELYSWRTTPEGRLAEVIVLDQFSRNMFRDHARSFEADPLALALAQEAVAGGHDQALEQEHRVFLYMPFMHSESPIVHEQAVLLFEQLGIESNLHFERRHKDVIDRFGRYPHRNRILGRKSTDVELEFLAQPGSSF